MGFFSPYFALEFLGYALSPDSFAVAGICVEVSSIKKALRALKLINGTMVRCKRG